MTRKKRENSGRRKQEREKKREAGKEKKINCNGKQTLPSNQPSQLAHLLWLGELTDRDQFIMFLLQLYNTSITPSDIQYVTCIPSHLFSSLLLFYAFITATIQVKMPPTW